MAMNNIYDKKRSDERLKFITKCRLDIDGVTYDGIVENISTAGAAIKVTSPGQDLLQVGQSGTLTVLLLSPVKYLCNVVRIDNSQIGVQFLET